jgi:hypothetical protein
MTEEKKTVAALVSEARALDAAATPGPWEHDGSTIIAPSVDSHDWRGFPHEVISACTSEDAADVCLTKEDAAFIARSRTLLVELADALERAEKGLRLIADYDFENWPPEVDHRLQLDEIVMQRLAREALGEPEPEIRCPSTTTTIKMTDLGPSTQPPGFVAEMTFAKKDGEYD